jgi:hypothetical protein
MKKLLAVVASIIALMITWMFGYHAGAKDANFHQVAITEVQHELADAVKVFKSTELANMAGYCSKNPTLHKTSAGTFWTTCSITGEFVDPATYKTVVDGNKTILPVGLYMRLENAQTLLQRGYTARDISLSVYAWESDPSKGNSVQVAEASFPTRN